MPLELVIRCATCGAEVDTWALDEEDPATNLCEIAGDLDFKHECPKPEEKK